MPPVKLIEFDTVRFDFDVLGRRDVLTCYACDALGATPRDLVDALEGTELRGDGPIILEWRCPSSEEPTSTRHGLVRIEYRP
jgi:hypothetical protein